MIEDTIMVMEKSGENTSIDLKRGSLFSKIHKITSGSFSVRTQAVVAGIRGTEFFMAYGRQIEDSPDIWLCVNEGTVEVAVDGSGESVLVDQGEGISILSGRTFTEPKPYEWTQDLNWNTDPKKGSVVNQVNLDQAYDDLLDQDYF